MVVYQLELEVLGIGLRTVEARRQAIFQKLGAQSLAELLRMIFDARTRVGRCSSDGVNDCGSSDASLRP